MTIRSIDKELLDACSALDEKRVLDALQAGADPNCFEEYENYPLLACLHADKYEFEYWEERNKGRSDEDDDDDYNDMSDAEIEEFQREMDRLKIRVFDLLLEHGADLNFDYGNDDVSPILWHAVHCTPRIVEYLLKKGANPNKSKEKGFTSTPLSHAWVDESINREDKKIAEELSAISRLFLSYGALPHTEKDIEEDSIDLSKIRTFEDIPPFVYPEMPENVKPLSEMDKMLFHACKELDVDAARQALDNGADINARDPDNDFATPLLEALHSSAPSNYDDASYAKYRKAKLQMASFLLNHKADPDLSMVMRTPAGEKEIIEYHTPLMQAAWLDKDVALTTLLLEHDANPNLISSSDFEETVMDLNNLDYNVDEPVEVKTIEMLLTRYGGCCSYIFTQQYSQAYREVDAALIYSCQRMCYESFQLAAKLGGNLSLTESDRTLPVILLQDAPQLCGKNFEEHGWDLEDLITDYLLFLLVGMKVPTDAEDRKAILNACIDNGYEKTLQVLVTHHSLGSLFRKAVDFKSFAWKCWPKEKCERMKNALSNRSFPHYSTLG